MRVEELQAMFRSASAIIRDLQNIVAPNLESKHTDINESEVERKKYMIQLSMASSIKDMMKKSEDKFATQKIDSE